METRRKTAVEAIQLCPVNDVGAVTNESVDGFVIMGNDGTNDTLSDICDGRRLSNTETTSGMDSTDSCPLDGSGVTVAMVAGLSAVSSVVREPARATRGSEWVCGCCCDEDGTEDDAAAAAVAGAGVAASTIPISSSCEIGVSTIEWEWAMAATVAPAADGSPIVPSRGIIGFASSAGPAILVVGSGPFGFCGGGESARWSCDMGGDGRDDGDGDGGDDGADGEGWDEEYVERGSRYQGEVLAQTESRSATTFTASNEYDRYQKQVKRSRRCYIFSCLCYYLWIPPSSSSCCPP